MTTTKIADVSTTAAEQAILVEQDADGLGRLEIVCQPFEAGDPAYAGERCLAIYRDGEEESFAVLKADHAARLAQLLVNDETIR